MRGERFQAWVGGDAQPDPKWAALRRAVRAVFDEHDRAHARWYTYVEVGSDHAAHAWPSDAAARAAYSSAQEAPGELYAAMFDAADPSWPDPIFHVYRAPGDVVAVSGPTSGPVTQPSQVRSELLSPFSGSGRYRVVVRLDDSIVPVFATDDLEAARTRAREVWLRAGAQAVIYDSKLGRNVGDAAPAPAPAPPDLRPIDPYTPAPTPSSQRTPAQTRQQRDRVLDHETDLLFWEMTKYKPGKRLSAQDPADVAMFPKWHEARELLRGERAARRLETRTASRRSLASDMAFREWQGSGLPFYVFTEEATGPTLVAFADPQSAGAYELAARTRVPYIAFFAADDPKWPEPYYELTLGDSGEKVAGTTMSDDTNPTGIISGHRGYAAPARGHGYGHGPHYWRAPFRDRLAYIAPIAYPAAAGAGVQFRLEGDTLVASICVDGRCYDGRYDLSEILARRGVDSFEQPTDPATANDAALEVAAAGDTLVGALLDDHVDAVIGGWWDDLSGAVSSTVKSLAGPIRSAAKMAVPALASLVPGGALVAPLATNLVDNMMAQATGTPQQAAQAKQNIAQVQQRAAAGDANAKKALRIAKRTLAKSSTTYHAAQTATNAASGNPDAQAQIAELQGAAAQGDQSAANLATLIRNLTSQLAASSVAPGGQPATPAASSWQADPAQIDPNAAAQDGSVAPVDPTATVASVSGVASTGRQAASAAAQAEYARSKAPAIGVVFQSNGAHIALPLESIDAADDWMGQLESGTFTYAAYFDPKDPTWPAPINERVGAKVVSSGWLAPVLAAAGGFGLGAAGWPWLYGKFSSWGHGQTPPAVTSPTTTPPAK